MTSFWRVSRSPLCFSCSSFIFGWIACIARCDLICLTKTGNSTTRTLITRKTMASTHGQLVPRTRPSGRILSHTVCQNSITCEITQ